MNLENPEKVVNLSRVNVRIRDKSDSVFDGAVPLFNKASVAFKLLFSRSLNEYTQKLEYPIVEKISRILFTICSCFAWSVSILLYFKNLVT